MPKPKSKSDSKIFVLVTKRITIGLTFEGRRQPSFFTFRPNKINTVPADIWGAMLAKKGSDNEITGEEGLSTVDEYKKAGWLWTVDKEQAQMIHDGQRPIMSPFGPNAGESDYVPPEPDRGKQTEGQKRIEGTLETTDPQFNHIDMGEIATSAVKPPPPPVVA